MAYNSISMEVNGQPVSIDFNEEMEIGDVSEDMTKVAAQLAFWGAVWAAAEAELKRADAAYRQWRADQTNMCLDADPKLAEWKVRAKVEEMDTFVKLKSAIAQAENNVISAKQVCEAFKVKAHVLQSFGALKRADMFAGEVRTTEKPGATKKSASAAEREAEREERKSAMRTMNRKKKLKKKSTTA